jgi:ankyrin repeat protein
MCSRPPHVRLFHAIDCNDAKKVKQILLKGNVDLLYKDPNRHFETCLHRAVRVGGDSITCLKLILESNIDLCEIESKDGKTPFLLAAQLGHFECIKFILENVAIDKVKHFIYHADDSRSNALHYAAEAKNYNIIEYVLKFIGEEMHDNDKARISNFINGKDAGNNTYVSSTSLY